MSLLNDEELAAAIGQQPPLVTHTRTDYGRWNSKIQPASIDISIGKIFLPGAEGDAPGSDASPLQSHLLEQGQTAVVESLETLNMPPDLAAFGFPPASVSMNGLLMTNPGHVDPGFENRKLRFTVINFGKRGFQLKAADPICTLLFLKMRKPPRVPYNELDVSEKPKEPNSYVGLLQRLSHDFMDVDERSSKKAKDAVDRIDLKTRYRQIFWPAAVTILTALGAFGAFYILNPLKTLNDKVIALEARSASPTADQLRRLEERLRLLEETRGQRP